MTQVLDRRDEALAPDDIVRILRKRAGDDAIVDHSVEYGTFTVRVAAHAWAVVAETCKNDPLLDYSMFDSLFGVDARDDGFRVVAVLYSPATGNRVLLDTLAPGGRDAPVCPTLTHLYEGANWMERETWDMFGIEFEGHPGLAPRILTVENFEGWPLRKDFFLTSRVAKPWPGVKEPAELDEEGNVVERAPATGEAPGPTDLDKAMAEHARRVNAVPSVDTDPGADEVDDEGADEQDDVEEQEEAGDESGAGT